MIPEVVTIGLGYIGLPTSALIAKHGTNVLGVDINQQVVDTINQGKIHIVEPDLGEIVSEAVSKGFFKASTKATSSTTPPLDVLIMIASFFINLNSSLPIIYFVSLVNGICKDIKSLCLINSSFETYLSSSYFSISGLGLLLQCIMFILNAFAFLAKFCPIRPRPIMPIVLPRKSFPKNQVGVQVLIPLFKITSCPSMTLLETANNNPNAKSAVESVTTSGVLDT